jgi:hypothetical protein
MIISSKLLKVILAILVFSLVVPISPSVSSAKAKICCKKNCKSMIGTSSPTTSNIPNFGNSIAGTVPCNNESCLITDGKSESFSLVNANEAKQLIFFLVSYFIREVPQGFQFIPAISAGTQQQRPPLYLTNSILRI